MDKNNTNYLMDKNVANENKIIKESLENYIENKLKSVLFSTKGFLRINVSISNQNKVMIQAKQEYMASNQRTKTTYSFITEDIKDYVDENYLYIAMQLTNKSKGIQFSGMNKTLFMIILDKYLYRQNFYENFVHVGISLYQNKNNQYYILAEDKATGERTKVAKLNEVFELNTLNIIKKRKNTFYIVVEEIIRMANKENTTLLNKKVKELEKLDVKITKENKSIDKENFAVNINYWLDHYSFYKDDKKEQAYAMTQIQKLQALL